MVWMTFQSQMLRVSWYGIFTNIGPKDHRVMYVNIPAPWSLCETIWCMMFQWYSIFSNKSQWNVKETILSDIPMIFQWLSLCKYSNGIPMIFQWYSSDVPMIFRWYSSDIPEIFQWHSTDIPVILQWYSNDIPVILRWYSNDIQRILQRFSDDIFQWYSSDIPMRITW